MSGSNMFIIYTDSTGNNVTVSSRLGTGHSMPQHDTAATIEVLEGTGVQSGVMTANVRCGNCESWSGGSMDFTASSGQWIYAYKSGSSLDSDDLGETISEHDGHDNLDWQFAQAKGGNDANPFVAAGGVSTGTGTAPATSAAPTTVSGTVIPGTCTPIAASNTGAASASATGGSTATVTSDDGCPTEFPPTSRPPASCLTRSGYTGRPTGPPQVKRDNGCPAGYESTQNGASGAPDLLSSSGSPSSTIVLAHGVIACLAFVAFFPLGGILIRVASFTGLIWIHAALQSFGFLLYIVAFGMGVYLATNMDYLSNHHPIIGIVLLVVLVLQPISGFLHHRLFKKYNSRTLWSYVHLWHGRVAILLGIINGGLGIQLAGDASQGAKIAYGVIAGLVGVVYIACAIYGAIYGEMKRGKKQPPSYEKSERTEERGQRRQSHQLRDLSSSEENVQNQGYYGRKERSQS